jgi:sterol desaturase/sphingolipid hydroxylase (fatty acid hydroxylase superfamily)
MSKKRGMGWLNLLLIGGAFGTLAWLELRRPLRRSVESKLRRQGRNFAVAALSAATIQLTQKPVTAPLTQLVQCRRWGLLKQFNLPTWLETTLAVALLDYTLYLWHILLHRVPFL